MTDLPSRLQVSVQDRYRVERDLGAGGMATVCPAGDLEHERHADKRWDSDVQPSFT